MVIVFFWLLLSPLVAGVAHHRGRSGVGWLLTSITLSPLFGGVLLLALTQKHEAPAEDAAAPNPQLSLPKKPTAFEPDGIYAGFPYRVSEGGAVEVLLASGRVRFRSLEQFLALAIKNPNLGKIPG